MRLIPRLRHYWKYAGCACLCIAAGACSGSLGDSNPFAQASSIFAKPDWISSGSKTKVSSVVTSEDLVGPDGACNSGVAPAVAPEPAPEPAPAPEAEPAPPATDGVSPRAPTPTAAPANDPVLQPAVGLALGLSECDVVRRAGHPDNVNVGADDRGERSVVLTYSRGERAGIYRFRQGRLFSIERVQVAEEPKPVKPKPVARPVKRAAKPAPANSFADPAASNAAAKPAPKTAWPAPRQQPPQNAPWPAAPAQQNPQSTVWPSPPKAPSG